MIPDFLANDCDPDYQGWDWTFTYPQNLDDDDKIKITNLLDGNFSGIPRPPDDQL